MKRALQVLALLSTIVVGAAAMAVIVTQTAWFKEWLRGFIVRQADDYVNGQLQIGRLDGNLFFGVELEDVSLTMNGRSIVAIKDLGLDYSVLELLGGGVVLDDIRINRPFIRLERTTEGWNLARIVKRQEQEAEREGPARPVTIGSIGISDGTFEIAGTGGSVPDRIERVDARFGFAYEPVNFTIDIGHLSFRAKHPGLALNALSGRIATREDELFIENLAVRTSESGLSLDGVISGYRSNPSIQLTASSPKLALEEFASLVPGLRGIRIQPAFEIHARGRADDLAVGLNVRSSAGQITGDVRADLSAPGRRAAGTLDLRHVDLGGLLGRAALASDITGRTVFDLRAPAARADLAALRGTWQIDAPRLVVAGYDARRVAARGRIERGVLHVDGRAAAYGGRATLTGTVGLVEPIRLDLAGRADDLDLRALPATLRVPAVASDLALDYRVRATLDGARTIVAAATFGDSTLAGGRIAAGSTASVRLAGTTPAYQADVTVANMDPRAIGRGLGVEALDRDRYAGRVNGRFIVDGAGSGLATLRLSARGTVSESVLLGGHVPSLDFDVRIEDGGLQATARGEFGGIDPVLAGAPARLAGTLSGEMDVRAGVSTLADGVALDEITADGRIALAESTVGGLTIERAVVDGTLREGAGDLRALEIQGPTIAARANGRVDLRAEGTTDVTVDVAHADLASLGAMAGQEGLGGSAAVKAEVTGPASALRATGTLDVSRLAHPRASALQISSHFDVLVPDLEVARARVTADTSGTLVEVAGRALTEIKAKTTYEGQTLSFDAQLRERQRAAEVAADVVLHPDHHEVHLHTLGVAVEGVEWRMVPGTETAVQYGGGRIAVDGLELASGEQRLRVGGTFGAPDARMTVSAERVDLAGIDRLMLGEQRLGGILDASAVVGGTGERPVITGSFTVRDGAFRDFKYQQLAGSVNYGGEGVRLDARLDQAPGAFVTAKGFVPRALLTAAAPAPGDDAHEAPPAGGGLEVRVETSTLDLGIVQGFVPQLTKVSGTLQADVTVTGTMRDPHLAGYVDIRKGAFTVADLTPAGYTGLDTRIALEPDRVRIEEFRLLDEHNQPLAIAGQIAVHERQVGAVEITLTSEGFEIVDNDLADVKLDTNLRISGELRRPVVQGSVAVDAGTIEIDRILDTFTSDPYPVEKDVGAGQGPRRPEAADRPSEAAGQPAVGGFDAVSLDVRARIPDNLVIKGSAINPGGASPVGLGDVNVTIGGDIRARKVPGGAVQLLGVVNTVRGTYDFQGRRFEIVRDGRIRFTGGDQINPRLDLTARRLISGVEVDVRVRGTARAPELTLTSRPPQDEADILSLIVFNQPVNALGEGEQVSLAQRAGALATGFVASSLASSIGETLELDVFEVQTTPEAGGGATVTLGEQVGQRLFLKFRQGVGAQAVSEFLLEYALTDYLRLQTSIAEGGAGERTLMQRREESGIDLILFFSY